MLPWKTAATLRARRAAYPAVALVGPRQCGKTTLIRSLDRRYFDLKQDPDRLRLGFLWKANPEKPGAFLSHGEHHIDHLEGGFLVRRRTPYSANIRKRISKRPKLHWRDTGLLHALLNVRDWDTLLNQSRVGTSWERSVIEQVLAALHSTGRPFDAYDQSLPPKECPFPGW